MREVGVSDIVASVISLLTQGHLNAGISRF